VASRAIKERAEGASDLRQILRHSQGTPKIDNLKEASIFKIFDALFSAIDLDLSIKRGNKPSKEKKPSIPAALLRLGSLAATLRVAVDVCLRNLKSKSIKALIDYIITNFTEADGSPITALAGDFASSLSILLAHEPHAEHLSPNLREEAITFCLAILNAECNHDEGLGSSILSSRSSRFHLAPSQADNGKNGLPRQAADDLVKALRSLTSVSFAPLLEKGPKLLDTMVQFVKTSPHMSKPQVDALVIINTTLLHVRTGDTESAKKFTRNAVALARALWNTKLAALKDEVLVMLVLLHPFIETLLQQGGDELFFIELANLVEVIKGDYVRRGAKDQLQLNQLTLRIAEKQPADGLQCWTFSLRDGLTVNENGLSCEHNWTLLKLSALFSVQNHVHGQRHVQRSVSPSDGPRKRLKVTQWSDEILRMLSDLSIPTRIYSLQIICFAAQCTPIEKRVLGTLVEKLSTYITDDNSSVASWAYLALTRYMISASL
jgi:ataxia telangiectasia mutated family protein